MFKKEVIHMVMNIIAGIMCAIVVIVGIYGWLMENAGSFKDKDEKTKEMEDDNKKAS